jgi:hypothetical protein
VDVIEVGDAVTEGVLADTIPVSWTSLLDVCREVVCDVVGFRNEVRSAANRVLDVPDEVIQ